MKVRERQPIWQSHGLLIFSEQESLDHLTFLISLGKHFDLIAENFSYLVIKRQEILHGLSQILILKYPARDPKIEHLLQ
jgi:hypothetical protein